jgi:protein O-mannosyl-transferase
MAIITEQLVVPGVPGRDPANAPTRKWEPWMVPLLCLVSSLCYANTLLNGFVYDDGLQILANPYVKSWRYLPQIFRTTVWSFIGAAGDTNYYRPMMTFTYLLLWKAFGELPSGYHLFNILLNSLVVTLVYLAGKELFKTWSIAAVAALLFAVHPIHTEPVAWIAAVPDLEATLLFVAAFYLYIRKPKLHSTSQVLVAACYVAALMAKEPALMLAPLLACYEHFVRPGHETSSTGAKLRQYLPTCLVGLGYLAVRSLLFGKLAPVLQHPQVTWPQAIFSAFALITSYTRLLFWPAPLSAFHTFHATESFWTASVLLGIAVVLACLLSIVYFHKRNPRLSFCVLWIGLTLAPVLNVRWMAANVLTERYLYLPSVAFCWLAAYAGNALWRHFETQPKLALPAKAILATSATLLVGFGIASIVRRNQVWRDDLTLYSATLQTDPDSYVMHMNLGTTYFATRNYIAAEKELLLALQIRPNSANVLNALGCVYLEENRLQDSEVALKQAIALKPNWTDSHFNYGRLLTKQGQSNTALSEFRTAVDTGPLNAFAHLYLAEALAERQENAEAEAQFRESIRLSPSLSAQQQLADLLLRTGRAGEALRLLDELTVTYPYDSATHLKRAAVFESLGRLADARKEYQKTLETDPSNSEARAALKRIGDIPQLPGRK